MDRITVCSFATELGWMALALDGERLLHVVFAERDEVSALGRLPLNLRESGRPAGPRHWLARRLIAYAAGEEMDFDDVQVDVAHLGPFQRRVVTACRRIGYGETLSYGEVAAAAGSAGAARAVGSVMRINRCPLVVPCHRVVAAGGKLGGFSCPEGVSFKARLLALENGQQLIAETKKRAKTGRRQPTLAGG